MDDKLTQVEADRRATGKAAAEAAIARARHAGLASLAAVLVPLGVLATTGTAHAELLPFATITQPSGPESVGNGEFSYTYTVNSSIGDMFNGVSEILIPELKSGDLFTGSGSLPSGWSGRQSRAFSPAFKTPNDALTAGATFALYNPSGSGAIGAGSSLTFTLYSDFGNTLQANVEVFYGPEGNSLLIVDPYVPNSNPAPEPSTLAVLGGGALMLARVRGRKKV